MAKGAADSLLRREARPLTSKPEPEADIYPPEPPKHP